MSQATGSAVPVAGRRGKLRVYLGAAPGVGKTFAMLGEGHRRAARGQDVVIGYIEDHGRPKTAAAAEGLEVIPRRSITYRGSSFPEMDIDAVLARRPSMALVDELAHTNVIDGDPPLRNEKRWQDVEELLAAGIDVITTVNVQHFESLNDVVTSITDVVQRETVPDEVVRRASQIELVDMSPESLRRRLAHGNVYKPEKVDAALSNYFRVGNLTALRELALLWLADRVDEVLQAYRHDHDIDHTWPARERVVVAITGGPEGETIIRRAARVASRASAAELMAVYITRGDGTLSASPSALAKQRDLVEGLGGSYHVVVGEDVPGALLEFARGVNATQLVIGTSRRRRLAAVLTPGIGATVVRESGDIDVHMVTHEYVGARARKRRARPALRRSRVVGGWVSAFVGPLLLTALLAVTRDLHDLPTEVMLFLAVVVGVAILGGLWPALVAALVGSALLNFFFTPPLYTLTIAEVQNIFVLAVFVLVGVAVAIVVDRSARRSTLAIQARAEADTLGLLARSVLRGEAALPALLERVRETFGMDSVALLERVDEQTWRCVQQAGTPGCADPDDADVRAPINDTLELALKGPALPADSRRLLEVFAAHAAGLVERERLSAEAAAARRDAEGNKIRVALLAAVSHDLRTPLAGIKAAATTLLQPRVKISAEDTTVMLRDIDHSADKLDSLIGNLLDMSRLQTGAVRPLTRDLGLEEVIPLAVAPFDNAGLSGRHRVHIDIPEDLPRPVADPGLLERVVANVVENALKYSCGSDVRISASALDDRVEIRVVDTGPGVPDDAKTGMFEPFQRLGDAPGGVGVGLGLAVSRGFTEAMGGEVFAEDTPGGGLTIVITLPVPDAAPSDEVPARAVPEVSHL